MNKIDELIYAYRGRIKTETKLRNMEIEEMKKMLNQDMFIGMEDKYSHLAKQIDEREKRITIMDYFIRVKEAINDLKKEIKAYE